MWDKDAGLFDISAGGLLKEEKNTPKKANQRNSLLTSGEDLNTLWNNN